GDAAMTARARDAAAPRIRGVYAKTKALADGRQVTYWYHRKTGARLPDDPGSDDFLERVLELNRGEPGRPVAAPRTRPQAGAGTQVRVTAVSSTPPPQTRAPAGTAMPGMPEKCFKALFTRYRSSPAFLDLVG